MTHRNPITIFARANGLTSASRSLRQSGLHPLSLRCEFRCTHKISPQGEGERTGSPPNLVAGVRPLGVTR